jgi:hypothetical protein
MSQNPEARMHGLQPTLPLVDLVEAAEEDVPSDTEAEWHLDEHTREVGRLGIAAARAHLRASSTGGRGDGSDRGSAQGAGQRVPGRAA